MRIGSTSSKRLLVNINTCVVKTGNNIQHLHCSGIADERAKIIGDDASVNPALSVADVFEH